jgi:galacturonosyltransferase
MTKVLFLANHFITLYSFRKEMIHSMLAKGYDLYLSLPKSNENEYFEKLGCKIIITNIDRRGINPVKDLQLLYSYHKIMKTVQPDIIFSFTIKPNIYGSLVSSRMGLKQICNITGTGATFLKESFLSKMCRILYSFSVKYAYKVFFQNTGDRDYFISHGMVGKQYEMLPGSGCNIEQHPLKTMPSFETINFIFIGRVMKLKGVDEYLQCAKSIHSRYPNTKFYIAGWNEEDSYKEKVAESERTGAVEYIGFRKDIDDWIAKCHCTILPSHGGEGVPNVLLESAATGRVCIASNICGSKEVVDDGVTGYLFKTGDSGDLIEKVERFLSLSDDNKVHMGEMGREKIVREFNREIVVNKYLSEIESVIK